MGIYNLNDVNEHFYMKESIAEANSLYGTEADFYQVDTSTTDLQNDPVVVYKDPVKVNIVFESNPKPVLRRLNWLVDGEDMPLLAYITDIIYNKEKSLPIFVNRYSLIKIPYIMQETGAQMFRVTKVIGDTINPLVWICTMVPYHDQTDINPNTPEVETSLETDHVVDFGFLGKKP